MQALGAQEIQRAIESAFKRTQTTGALDVRELATYRGRPQKEVQVIQVIHDKLEVGYLGACSLQLVDVNFQLRM